MAKVSFNKLGLKVNINEVPVQIGEETIAVKQYLPIDEKLQLIGRVIEQAHDTENNFANPVKTDVYMILEIIEAYTNISFTDKQKEDIPGLYDKFICNNVWATIKASIPQTEYDDIQYGVYATNDAFYKYRNSAMGILDIIKQDYSDLNLNALDIQQKLADPNNKSMIQDLLTKLN